MRRTRVFVWLVAALLSISQGARADDGAVVMHTDGTGVAVQIEGDNDDDWFLQFSPDLVHWTTLTNFGTLLSDRLDQAPTRVVGGLSEDARFFRALRTEGIFDARLLRTISLTITNASYVSLLTTARTTGRNVPARLEMDNGLVLDNVGARYKGNTSFTMGGNKKSVNLDINYTNSGARAMGYRALNLNNAAADETILREVIYFNVMRRYTPCPHGALARLIINGRYWGVYSLVDQINNDLLDEYFPSHEGDRWRAPNTGGGGGGPGGGGGFASANSAFAYLGNTNVSTYRNYYELKSDNSTNAYERLINAIYVLHNTPTNSFRDRVEDVFAVDSWLWFLGIEIIFADDDSYWNKGADYAFYYEPESGRIHPVQHDGNEAFVVGDAQLSPVTGATAANRPLLNKFLPVPELRQRYLAHVRTVLEESFHPDKLTPEINDLHALSIAAIIADTNKNYTMTAYTNDLVALRRFVTNRYNFLTNHAELRPLQPIIGRVRDPKPLPKPGEVPFITAEVQSNNGEGIDSVWLYWRDKPYGKFSRAQMFDDGAHGDGAAGDGVFGGATEAFPAGNKIHYYVEARSANSARAAAFSPPRAEQDTYSYRVALATAVSSPVVINELMASNASTIADPQGHYDDWIELWNLSDEPVDLTGKYLSDNPNNPRKWKFPEGTVIPADDYLIVWADEDGPDTPGLHANFKLSASGEEVFLLDTDASNNAILDAVTFGAQTTDRSYGRNPHEPAVFAPMTPTPGAPNQSP